MSQSRWISIERLQRRGHVDAESRGFVAIVALQEELQRTALVQQWRRGHNAILNRLATTTRLDPATLVAAMPAGFAVLVADGLAIVAHASHMVPSAADVATIECSKWWQALAGLGHDPCSTAVAAAQFPAGVSAAPPVLVVGGGGRGGGGFGASVVGMSRSGFGRISASPSMRYAPQTPSGGPAAVAIVENVPFLPQPVHRASAQRSLWRVSVPDTDPGFETKAMPLIPPTVAPSSFQPQPHGTLGSSLAPSRAPPARAMTPAARTMSSTRPPLAAQVPATPAVRSGGAGRGLPPGRLSTSLPPGQHPSPMQPAAVSTPAHQAHQAECKAGGVDAEMPLIGIMTDLDAIDADSEEEDLSSGASLSTTAAAGEFATATSLLASCVPMPSHTSAGGVGAMHVLEDALSYSAACAEGHGIVLGVGTDRAVAHLAEQQRLLMFNLVQTAKDEYVAGLERRRLAQKQRAAQRAQGSAAWRRRKQQDQEQPAAASPTKRNNRHTVKEAPRTPTRQARSPSPASKTQTPVPKPSSAGTTEQRSPERHSPPRLSVAPPEGRPVALKPLSPDGRGFDAGEGEESTPESFTEVFHLVHGRPVPRRSGKPQLPSGRLVPPPRSVSAPLTSARGASSRHPASPSPQRHQGAATPALHGGRDTNVSAVVTSDVGRGLTPLEQRQKMAVRYEVLRRGDARAALDAATAAVALQHATRLQPGRPRRR
jgi:hypothetical protein